MPRTPRRSPSLSIPQRPRAITGGLGRPDWLTLGLYVGLSLLGLLMIFNASTIEALYDFGDKYHFVKLQLAWLAIALAAATFALVLPFSWLKRLSPSLFIGTLIILILVLIPGIGTQVQGARRWLYLGSFSLQPSEVAKLTSLLYFPAILIKRRDTLPVFIVALFTLTLVLLQPDFGTTVILAAIIASIYFASGTPVSKIVFLGLGALTLAVVLVISSPYRFDRVKTFLDPTTDPLGSSYHIRQVLISLGSGGIIGTGIGRSRQKYQYLPEATTDSIFAVTAEEIGFIGSSIVLLLYVVAAVRGLRQAARIGSPYPYLVAVGAVTWFTVQTWVNIASMVALIPLTGVPLPFFSYGGSSLVTLMIALGLYGNASRYRRHTQE